jgi:hypothetical protein
LVRTLEFTDFKLSPFRCRDPATKDQPPLDARGQNLKRDLLNFHQQEPVDIAGSRQTLILPKLESRRTGLSESNHIMYIVKENIEHMICSFFFEHNRAGAYFHVESTPIKQEKMNVPQQSLT